MAKITRDTLLPIGLVIGLVVATWAMASDRQTWIGQARQNTSANRRQDEDIRELRKKLEYLTQAMIRVEASLGTLPQGGGP